MAQKINPISFRLGSAQIWNSNLQIYGKSYFIYSSLLFRYLEINNLIEKILKLKGLSMNNQEWKIGKAKIKLVICYSELVFLKTKPKLPLFRTLFNLVNSWLSEKIVITLYFTRPGKSLFNDFLTEYSRYLMHMNMPSKKVIWSISKFIKVHLGNEKVISYKKGILKIKLKGFKISLSGRLEDSKSQMAKNVQHSEGSLPLNTVKNYIDYSNSVIYTKNGTCGLKIWLFYEFY
uniref:Ribosomal protein S3 n=1 Tax=Eucheuma denticulatum TaxID=305493 RepID=A0A2H4QI52_9FLOR|nr:ribosomal protein S3 [Eucheuma denticulatum]ATX68848.1 ribosomal protein S3 [Eucheuma denticulatum]